MVQSKNITLNKSKTTSRIRSIVDSWKEFQRQQNSPTFTQLVDEHFVAIAYTWRIVVWINAIWSDRYIQKKVHNPTLLPNGSITYNVITDGNSKYIHMKDSDCNFGS